MTHAFSRAVLLAVAGLSVAGSAGAAEPYPATGFPYPASA